MEQASSLILIVDDNLQNLKVLGNSINEKGWPMAIASSGEQALKFLKKKKPALILLDIMMPEMDGFEVCQRIKEDPETHDIPVIFLTAKDNMESIVRGFEVGAVDYISKPFNVQELLKRVGTHLELHHNRQALKEKNEIQKELIHVLCHDLSNPLAAIMSFSEMLQEEPEDAVELGKHITRSATNGMEIIRLIRDLRAFEEKDIETRKLNLKEIIDEARLILLPKLKEKGIVLEVNMEDQIEVIAEEVSLKNTVINNLLTNAIKFSEPGAVIRIDITKTDEHVLMSVVDHGIGIPRQILNDLFDVTKNTNRTGTRGERGTGFGMPLVKKFIERYGGQIEVSSKAIQDFPDDHGTEIKLTFQSA